MTCSLVLCRHVEDAIGVNVKDDGDLWDATGRRWDAGQLKLAQQVVVASS